MTGAVSPFGRRIIFRHVLHENVARRHAFHQKRPDIANHRSDPIFPFQRVTRPNGNRFLTQARVKPSDNLVLPEELHHGLFHGAVQTHVVIQVDVLLPRQFSGRLPERLLGHSCSHCCSTLSPFPFYAETTTDCSANSSFLSNSSFELFFNSRPNNSPRCLAMRGATSDSFTVRPSTFSSDVALRSAMPHGTIKSKNRKSVETLYANPCEVIQRLMCTPMAPSFSEVASCEWRVAREDPSSANSTQTPVFPGSLPAVIPNSAVARIMASSSLRTFQTTSRRISPRFRMG